ncbi:transposase [Paracoccus sp. MKU1]|uniref:transposase n=1 Tax=Paracoccus sp. MKU1 TaxID=1745182 RepID=UPI0007192D3A|nr:hypothetical protein AQY21_18265 [Paracoccus sp. MKU1]
MGDRQKVMRLTTDEFIRRFPIHVLPDGFHIRGQEADSAGHVFGRAHGDRRREPTIPPPP